MTRIAIIAAMPGELKPLAVGWQHERRNGVDLWRWQPDDQGEWVAACAGTGVSAATRAFAEIETDGPISFVISTGWAGALSEDFTPGKAYRVSEVIDSRTGERFATAANPAECRLVTSPRVADAPEKRRLAAAYSAGLVDMEASALARLALMRGIPFDCVKAVSDGFSEQLPDFNRFISEDGRFHLARFILFVILRPWYWPALVRMGENSKQASHAIRDSLLEILDGTGAIRKATAGLL